MKVGHRNWCLCMLASYAYKCSFYDEKKNPNPVTEEELRKDAYSMIPIMRELQNDFDEDDVESAMNFFQECYIGFPRNEIVKVSGLQLPVNKRNGRKQEVHLAGARAIQKVNDEFNGTNWKDGNGRKSKQNIVLEWRNNNPTGKKIECHRDTKLSRPKIDKWWGNTNLTE